MRREAACRHCAAGRGRGVSPSCPPVTSERRSGVSVAAHNGDPARRATRWHRGQKMEGGCGQEGDPVSGRPAATVAIFDCPRRRTAPQARGGGRRQRTVMGGARGELERTPLWAASSGLVRPSHGNSEAEGQGGASARRAGQGETQCRTATPCDERQEGEATASTGADDCGVVLVYTAFATPIK